MIQPQRLRSLNAKDIRKGDFVLYWMQASARAAGNHALEYAVRRANEQKRPCLAFFGLTDRYPEANLRHYAFLLEGLRETRRNLEAKGIQLVVRRVSPEKGVLELARRASLVVVDRGYLRVQKAWREAAAGAIDCPLIQVESEAVVPVETASPKEEWAAASFRPKIRKLLAEYLVPLRERKPRLDSLKLEMESLDLEDPDGLLRSLEIDRSVPPSPFFRGGAGEAKRRLKVFLRDKLDHFHDLRNNPSLDYLSHLSPYLHFGQVSPLEVALAAAATKSPGREAFLEELIVRRELALNFVHYNSGYDSFEAVPSWARKDLQAHLADDRPSVYSLEELEAGRTHDPYWNAAQREMVVSGKMHGYMRMYWGKKILEWSPTPELAFAAALALNNKYELDGRDPNGFAGVAWCFGKHDRPWQERKIFGHVRTMNDRGLRRKFDIDQYVRRVDGLENRAAT
ncbi:MAG: deoxyribodipyrimidine photolyase [Candidatus Aminicenantes bacterium]|nr:deoxyribodipyrimidine photolyase [Candidatus Aminicenantes bacterium]